MKHDDQYVRPIKVMTSCTEQWIDETIVEFLNIEEDIQGRDILTFKCPLCHETHRSLRVG